MNLYERIKNRRKELNMSQDELANKLGYKSRSTIAKIEAGINDIPQSKIQAFADALNTTPSYLMGWDADVLNNAPLAMLEHWREQGLSEEEMAKAFVEFQKAEENDAKNNYEENLIEKEPIQPKTIAAHLPEGVELTEEEQKQLDDYIQFILSRRKK